MRGASAAGLCAALVVSWVALYRFPLASPTRRRRVSLWLGDKTGVRADPAFAVFATLLYLFLGSIVVVVFMRATQTPYRKLLGHFRPTTSAALILAILGTSSLNTLWIALLYKVRPGADVPGEISRIQWISSILALPPYARWMIPAVAAFVEELAFRGAAFLGMEHAGLSFGVAAGISTLLFFLGQVALVTTATQAFVMGTASLTLGFTGTLLVAATGSVVPAIIVHASFAGFYSNMSTSSSASLQQVRAS